jgi:hypothetical protein
MRRNTKTANDLRDTNRPSKPTARAQSRNRRMFFETLEARQVMAVASDTDLGTFWERFAGNYVPPQEFKATRPDYLSGPASGSPLTIAVNYLKQNASVYGIESRDLDHYIVTNQYQDDYNGVTHIYLQQTYNGLPIADALASINVSPTGRVLTAGINFVSGLPTPPPFSMPTSYTTATAALSALASQSNRPVNLTQIQSHPYGGTEQLVYFTGSGLGEFAADHVSAQLHYIPKPNGSLELAWKFVTRYDDGTHWFEASLGTQFGGRVNEVIRLGDYVWNAAYYVYAQPVENPLEGIQTGVTNPQDPTASPFGWHDTNGFVGPEFFDLRGNNVSVAEDLNGDLSLGTSPSSPILDFNVPIVLPSDPATYTDASSINLFYWMNLTHDITYHYGFNEKSGNFQTENYNNLGLDSDAVRAFTQSPIAINNAFFATPPDGQAPFSAFGRTTLTAPDRDIALDSTVVVHEFTHGISNRLTGGPANANALLSIQSGGMGEGWSDWLGMLLTIAPGETRNTARTVGEWNFPGGLRRQPYSFDLAIDPLTLDDFNGGFPNNEVHNAGEIWASTLWDLSWLLIDKYGFDNDWYNGDGGNNLVMQLVLDGMKLQPANPSFLEARDAIIAADVALNGGVNYTEIWTAFARRGMGLFADDGASAAATVVFESFVMPPPLSGVSGTVYEDVNLNNQINTAIDTPLANWTIYADLNNNNALDAGEPQTASAADGTYILPVNGLGTVTIREIVEPGFQRILPASGGFTVTVSPNTSFTGRNFLNRQAPGEVTGIKFNDLNANGIRDAGEPVLAGVMIYVDVNKDGRIGVLEPASVTDANGVYRIVNVPVGTNTHVREVVQPGMVQTFPDPLDSSTLGGAHVNIAVTPGAVTSGINFGNVQRIDFGDAPESYGTSLASNGPRHGIVLGYGLTFDLTDAATVVDAEANGQPHPSAQGDDLTGVDDENGVLFLSGLTPGAAATVRVGVRSTGYSSGVLQGWVDFNRDGDFLDPGEQIIKNLARGTGIHDIQFAVPSTALLGSTFARFRYGIERNIGPLGAASAGEVEDLTTDILQDMAIATNDTFPDLSRVPPDPFIQLNSVDNPLDVLRNDFGSSIDPTPEIVGADFTGPGMTLPTDAGGTVRFVGSTQPLLYTPAPGYTGPDSFQYRVTANGSAISSPAIVSLSVSPSDPIAIDDIVRFNTGATNENVFVLLNDIAALNQAIRVKVGSPVALTLPNPAATLTRSANGDRLIFSANGFTGTVRYQYTIEDDDLTTADSTAIVTIQVTPNGTTPAASHAATFRTQYVAADQFGNPTGGPISMLNLADSEFFFVQLIVNDPVGTPSGLPETTGVESAYVDMLINDAGTNPLLPMVEAVRLMDGNFDIRFTANYNILQANSPNFSIPGVLNEIGASHGQDPTQVPVGVGNGEQLVMSVKFQALQGGTVTIQPDHADSPQLPILLFDGTTAFPGPIQIPDEQVFIQTSGPLTVVGGSGEGEFSNFGNLYDVNSDTVVNTLDLVMIVNDLTSHGPRPLNQFAIALAGVLPAGYLDTNLDSFVNTLDLLAVINYLTSRGAVVATGGGSGEGEGEASATPDGGEGATALLALAAPSVDPADEALNVLAAMQNREEAAELATPAEEDTEVVTLGSTSVGGGAAVAAADDDDAPTTRKFGSRGDLDSEAADELFGRLSDLRESLRSRRRGR